jgi:DNA polymerase III subunit beta
MFNLSIDKEQFLKLLLLVSGATAEKKPGMPILANICMILDKRTLTLIGTDTEVEVVATCETDEHFMDPESVTVQAKKIVDICRTLPEKSKILLKTKDNKLLIQSGKSRFSLVTLPATDFPKINEKVNNEHFSVKAADLKYLFQSTSFSMAQEDIRVYLNGLLLEKIDNHLIAAATDGHRLAVCKMEMLTDTAPFRVILPRKGVLELSKLLDTMKDDALVDLMVSDSHFYVEGDNYTFATKQLNCQYPNYLSVIPKNCDKSVKLERENLKQILSRVTVLANEKKRGVCFDFKDNLLKILVNNAEQEAGEDEMEVSMEGSPFETSFNIRYVMDVLNNLPSIEMKMSCGNPDLGILFESEVVSQVQYVIMPMKI